MSPEEVVGLCYQSWGEGKFNGPDRFEWAKKMFHDSATFDYASEAQINVVDACKVYHGPSGVVELCRRLADYDYIDFTPTIHPAKDNTVLVRVTYDMLCKSTGLKQEGCVDLMCWVVDGDKIKSATFTFGTMEKFLKVHEFDYVGTINTVFNNWFQGKYSTPDVDAAMSVIQEHYHEDFVGDARAPMTHARAKEIYSTFEGQKGFYTMIQNFEDFEFPDFTVTSMTKVEDSVVVKFNSKFINKATGKSVAFDDSAHVQVWKFFMGKIKSVKFYFDQPELIDATFTKE